MTLSSLSNVQTTEWNDGTQQIQRLKESESVLRCLTSSAEAFVTVTAAPYRLLSSGVATVIALWRNGVAFVQASLVDMKPE